MGLQSSGRAWRQGVASSSRAGPGAIHLAHGLAHVNRLNGNYGDHFGAKSVGWRTSVLEAKRGALFKKSNPPPFSLRNPKL